MRIIRSGPEVEKRWTVYIRNRGLWEAPRDLDLVSWSLHLLHRLRPLHLLNLCSSKNLHRPQSAEKRTRNSRSSKTDPLTKIPCNKLTFILSCIKEYTLTAMDTILWVIQWDNSTIILILCHLAVDQSQELWPDQRQFYWYQPQLYLGRLTIILKDSDRFQQPLQSFRCTLHYLWCLLHPLQPFIQLELTGQLEIGAEDSILRRILRP